VCHTPDVPMGQESSKRADRVIRHNRGHFRWYPDTAKLIELAYSPLYALFF
jgi:hypothetical protein